jgi:hypothetical protein
VRGVRLATDEDLFLRRDDLVEFDVYLVRALGAVFGGLFFSVLFFDGLFFDGLFFGGLLVGAVLDGLVDGHHGASQDSLY